MYHLAVPDTYTLGVELLTVPDNHQASVVADQDLVREHGVLADALDRARRHLVVVRHAVGQVRSGQVRSGQVRSEVKRGELRNEV